MTRRRWLLLLPVALVLVLAASAGRLQIFWWPSDLRDETSGREGEAIEVVDVWTDEDGQERERRFSLTVLSVRPVTFVDGYSGPERVVPPPGVAAWRILLEFDVDPDVPMLGCRVSLLDDRGREADAVGGSLGDALLPGASCEPKDRRGPDYTGAYDEDYLPRLQTYVAPQYVLTADDATPASVRLWWEPTDYVEVAVEGSGS